MGSMQGHTAHEVRRLQASVKDLQNALRVALKIPAPARPARALLLSASTTEAGASNSNDPYTRILANNDRGVVHDIQRVQDVGVVVIGLDGVGRLVAEACVRYGVQYLVLADSSEITDADLDGMAFQVEDVGWLRDERLAMALRRLNPDVEVASLALSPNRQGTAIVEVLRRKLAPSGDDDNETQDDTISEDASSAEPSNAAERHDGVIKPLHIVFLCGKDGGDPLMEALNDLCCEFGLLFVFISVGVDGMSGESILAAPGVSSCLQCLQKRKVWKAPPPTDAASLAPCLPSTDCILAGLGVQNAFMHLLSFGSACSRLEYDGFLEELVRSELLAPVRQCPSAACRQQQMQQHPLHQHRVSPPSTAKASSIVEAASIL